MTNTVFTIRLSLVDLSRSALASRLESTKCKAYGKNSREFKQITTAGATTAVVTEKVWGEYVSVVYK